MAADTPGSTPLTHSRLTYMMSAYKETSVLKAGIRLGVFDELARKEPQDAESLSALLGSDPRGTRILLNALAALHLLDTDGHEYRLTEGAAELLARDSDGYAGDMIHVIASDFEWDALKNLDGAVRHGGTVLDEHAETPEYSYWEDFAAYAPHVAKPTAQVLADALEPWARDREGLDVLDVACGHGVYGYTVAQRYEQAAVWSLDWKNVLDVTAKHAESMGVLDRTEFIVGDMFDVSLGGPYDLVLVTNVLHHFSDERAQELLRRAASALKPGGKVGVVGFVTSDEPPMTDPAPHLFSVLMLVWTAEGEVHSERDYERMFAAAGLEAPSIHPVENIPFHVLLAGRA
ncbi:class I SAM-dependent methyltransferase [Streptomyces albidus (ex Kaewkla and Franco 2022)]|uniref:class I SAM-dependent methyltransferase n=1 Tax=Streptomyces albidus (ex Kaewkla and Franco 2022) TaxID=722709 RepID=UPI001B35774D|nr:class I SAM-dependent methyltransferase [Streptomyces albidus (ex Kaewkla and Franco 2022)]